MEKVDETAKPLVDLGKSKGYITYTEINDNLPEKVSSGQSLDQVLEALEAHGIEVVDDAEAWERTKGPDLRIAPNHRNRNWKMRRKKKWLRKPLLPSTAPILRHAMWMIRFACI